MQNPDIKILYPELQKFYAPEGDERAGFIMTDGSIVEVRNIAENRQDDFLGYPDDIVKYCDDAVGSWHTHPGKDGNLSVKDYYNFSAWEDLYHCIVGSDGVRTYRYDTEKKAVMELEFV